MNFCDINGEYKQIRGFDDYYITEFGEVYSMRLRGREKKPHLHILKPKDPKNSTKYLNVILCRNDGQYTFAIHRLVAEHFVGGYFDGAVVNHIDGDNRNNAASNLEWVTTRDNIQKSYITSGVGAKRNCKIWELYDKHGVLIGTFNCHMDMENFVKEKCIDASPTQLTKKGNSRGYIVNKTSRY